MMKHTLYIAYGSNLNIRQMAMRCPGAETAGTGAIPGYRLAFKALGANAFATIEPCGGESVPVALWRIGRRDEEALDRYEGYPSHYGKVRLDVLTGDGGEAVSGIAYVMNPKAVPQIPSTAYFETVLSGYRSFGLDEQKLFEAWRMAESRDFPAGGRLQSCRRRSGLTQEQLAEAAGVPLRTLQKYESGERSIARARSSTVLRLAQVLDIPPYLLSR